MSFFTDQPWLVGILIALIVSMLVIFIVGAKVSSTNAGHGRRRTRRRSDK